MGIDDNGNERSISPDPMLSMLQEEMKGIEFGNPASYKGQLKKILKNENIFGLDLEETGLSDLVEKYFVEMIEGAGAVQETLKKYL